MNFLAHIYLSGKNKDIILGNFMGDHIKGKAYKNFSPSIQKGILLHRAIDSYTDTHSIVKRSKKRLCKRYGHFSGVIIDIFYDHFLAKNWNLYSEIPLLDFTLKFYTLIKMHFDKLPEKTQSLAHYMMRDNWLYSYRNIEDIATVLENMNKRTGNISNMHLAIDELKNNYTDLEKDFFEFFENLRTFCEEKLQELNGQNFSKKHNR